MAITHSFNAPYSWTNNLIYDKRNGLLDKTQMVLGTALKQMPFDC